MKYYEYINTLTVMAVMLCSFIVYGAAPINKRQEKNLILGSSIGFDRSPCNIDWRQFNKNWKYTDTRLLRSSNETWTGLATGVLPGMTSISLIVALDNHRGYSSVIARSMDKYCSFTSCKIILPNQPWRHYTGVAVCDLDRDGIFDILAIATNAKGQRGIIWFKLKKDGRLQRETMLIKLSNPAGGIAAVNISPQVTDILVAFPGTKRHGGKVAKYGVSSSLKRLTKDNNFLHIPSSYGQLGGLDYRWKKQRRKKQRRKLELVICCHDWDKELPSSSRPTNKKVTQTNTGFILPVANIEQTQSYLYSTTFKMGRRPTRLRLRDKMTGRRWVDVAWINDKKIEKTTIKPISISSKADRILHIKGLFSHEYPVRKLANEMNLKYQEVFVKLSRGMYSTKNFDYKHLQNMKIIFLSDVPLWALGSAGAEAIENYVRGGGIIVFSDGPFASGYVKSDFETIMPVNLRTTVFTENSADSLSQNNDFVTSAIPANIWYMEGRIAKPNATTIVSNGKETIVARLKINKGMVIYLGAIPLGNKSNSFIWNSLDWSKLLSFP